MIQSVLNAQAATLVERVLPSLVIVGERGSYGTGVVWSEHLLITNDHVAHSNQPAITLLGDRVVRGEVLARDRRNDLAAIELPSGKHSAVEIADSCKLQVGQLVVALGHPLGLKDAASFGIVSGISNASWMGRHTRQLLQLDLKLAPGNSGGPILNAAGRLVGIACMVASPGIALAVPAHLVAEFVEHLERRNVA